VSALIGLLGDADVDVRWTACHALGAIGPKAVKAVEGLERRSWPRRTANTRMFRRSPGSRSAGRLAQLPHRKSGFSGGRFGNLLGEVRGKRASHLVKIHVALAPLS
jgi:hypothetical protein